MARDTTEQFMSHLGKEEEGGKNVSIFRVPYYMKAKSSEDFEPKELFVGFYCHKSLVLHDPRHMDISKVAIARAFCRGPRLNVPPTSSPVNRPNEVWTEFVASFDKALMVKARQMYDNLEKVDRTVTENESFVVILDALFILAYLRFEYSFNDCWEYEFQPVFEQPRFNGQRFPFFRDLLMLENQVPMCLLLHVMRRIHRPGMKKDPPAMLYDLLEWFVIQVYPFNHGVKLDASSDGLEQYLRDNHKNSIDSFLNCKHLLDCANLAICGPDKATAEDASEFCFQVLPCFKPGSVVPSDSTPTRNRFRIPSVTSLRRVGITVTVRGDSLTMKDIKFERQNKFFRHKYVLLVPKLIMNDDTASVFRNLALYEQIKDNGSHSTKGDIRTYLYLMSSLIDNVQDVCLLMNRGVIVNQLGSAEDVCKQWNQMCNGLFIPPNGPPYWSDIQKRIRELEKSRSNRWFAEMEERNFSSIITFIAFLVFCIIFSATILQAVFSVLSYTG